LSNLLHPIFIEVGRFGDRRILAQQPGELRLPLLGRSRSSVKCFGGQRARKVALRLAHELVDAQSGKLRFLLLRGFKIVARGTVGKPRLDPAGTSRATERTTSTTKVYFQKSEVRRDLSLRSTAASISLGT